MSTALAVPDSKTLFAIVDDLTAYSETLDMLDAQLALALPDDERAVLQRQRAEAEARRDEIGLQLADKTDAIAAVLRRLDAERDFIHEERGRLKLKEAACERADEWLRKYVLAVMQRNGLSKLKTATNTLCVRQSDAVEITDAAAVPPVYQNAEVKMPLWLWLYLRDSVEEGTELRRDLDALRVHAEPSLSTIQKGSQERYGGSRRGPSIPRQLGIALGGAMTWLDQIRLFRRLSNLEVKVAATQQDVDNLTTQVTNIAKDVTGIASDVTAIDAGVKVLEAEVADLQKNNPGLDLSGLTAALGSLSSITSGAKANADAVVAELPAQTPPAA